MQRYSFLFAASLIIAVVYAQDRNTRVLTDREQVAATGLWIYNDLPRAFEEAKRTGKPILAVIR